MDDDTGSRDEEEGEKAGEDEGEEEGDEDGRRRSRRVDGDATCAAVLASSITLLGLVTRPYLVTRATRLVTR